MNYLNRYRPSLLSDLNKLFDTYQLPMQGGDNSSIDTSQWVPAVDIKEDATCFTIMADLPGIDKSDINISMENNILTIKGERSSETKEEKDNYSRIERVRGSFYRRFSLPDTADSGKVQASMQNGVLRITVRKKELAQPRSIEISNAE